MTYPIDFSFNSTIYSNRSTSATCYERQEIRQSVDNEWYRAAVAQAGFEDSLTIMQIYIEPLSDYLSPDPIRSYNVKLRITSKSKGLPHSYNEPYEDIL
jgi:hypothetical protein